MQPATATGPWAARRIAPKPNSTMTDRRYAAVGPATGGPSSSSALRYASSGFIPADRPSPVGEPLPSTQDGSGTWTQTTRTPSQLGILAIPPTGSIGPRTVDAGGRGGYAAAAAAESSGCDNDQPLDLTGGGAVRKRRPSNGDDRPGNADDSPLDLSLKRPRPSAVGQPAVYQGNVSGTAYSMPRRRMDVEDLASRPGPNEPPSRGGLLMYGGGVISRPTAAAPTAGGGLSSYRGIHVAHSPVPLSQLQVSSATVAAQLRHHPADVISVSGRPAAVPVIRRAVSSALSNSVSGGGGIGAAAAALARSSVGYRPGPLASVGMPSRTTSSMSASTAPGQNAYFTQSRNDGAFGNANGFAPNGFAPRLPSGAQRTSASGSGTHHRSYYPLQRGVDMAARMSASRQNASTSPPPLDRLVSTIDRGQFVGYPVSGRTVDAHQSSSSSLVAKRRGLASPGSSNPYITPPPAVDQPESTLGAYNVRPPAMNAVSRWQLTIPRPPGMSAAATGNSFQSSAARGSGASAVGVSGSPGTLLRPTATAAIDPIDVDSADSLYFGRSVPSSAGSQAPRDDARPRPVDWIDAGAAGANRGALMSAVQSGYSAADGSAVVAGGTEMSAPDVDQSPGRVASSVAMPSGDIQAASTGTGGGDVTHGARADFRSFDRAVVSALPSGTTGVSAGPTSRRIPIANVQPIMKEASRSATALSVGPGLVSHSPNSLPVDKSEGSTYVTLDRQPTAAAPTASTLNDLESTTTTTNKDVPPVLAAAPSGPTGQGRMSSHHMEYVKFLRQTSGEAAVSGPCQDRRYRTISHPRSAQSEGDRRKTGVGRGRASSSGTSPGTGKVRRQLLPQFSQQQGMKRKGQGQLPHPAEQSLDANNDDVTTGSKSRDDGEIQAPKLASASSSSSGGSSSEAGSVNSTASKKTPVVYFDDEDSMATTDATSVPDAAGAVPAAGSSMSAESRPSTTTGSTRGGRGGKVRRPTGRLPAVRPRRPRLDDGSRKRSDDEEDVGTRGGSVLEKTGSATGNEASSTSSKRNRDDETGQTEDMSDTEDEMVPAELQVKGEDADAVMDDVPPAAKRKRNLDHDASASTSADTPRDQIGGSGSSDVRRPSGLVLSSARGGRRLQRQDVSSSRGGVRRRGGGAAAGSPFHIRRQSTRGRPGCRRGGGSTRRPVPCDDGDAVGGRTCDDDPIANNYSSPVVGGRPSDDYDYNESDGDDDRSMSAVDSRPTRGRRKNGPARHGFQYPEVFGRRRARGGAAAGRRMGRRAPGGVLVVRGGRWQERTDGIDRFVTGNEARPHDYAPDEQPETTSSTVHPSPSSTPLPSWMSGNADRPTGSLSSAAAAGDGMTSSLGHIRSAPDQQKIRQRRLYKQRRVQLAAGRLGGRRGSALVPGAGPVPKADKSATAAGRWMESIGREAPGETALHKATRLDYVELVYYFLLSGCIPPDAQDNEGRTALHISCSRGNLPITRMLLAFGAHPNCKMADGTRPLHCAVACNHVYIVRELLACGADVTMTSSAQRSVLQLAKGRAVRQLIHGVLCDLKNSEDQQEIPWEFPACFDRTRCDVFDDVPASDDDAAQVFFDVTADQTLPVYRLHPDTHKSARNYHRVSDVISSCAGVVATDDDYVILNGDLSFAYACPPPAVDRPVSDVRHQLVRPLPATVSASLDDPDSAAFVELDAVLRDRLDVGACRVWLCPPAAGADTTARSSVVVATDSTAVVVPKVEPVDQPTPSSSSAVDQVVDVPVTASPPSSRPASPLPSSSSSSSLCCAPVLRPVERKSSPAVGRRSKLDRHSSVISRSQLLQPTVVLTPCNDERLVSTTKKSSPSTPGSRGRPTSGTAAPSYVDTSDDAKKSDRQSNDVATTDCADRKSAELPRLSVTTCLPEVDSDRTRSTADVDFDVASTPEVIVGTPTATMTEALPLPVLEKHDEPPPPAMSLIDDGSVGRCRTQLTGLFTGDGSGGMGTGSVDHDDVINGVGDGVDVKNDKFFEDDDEREMPELTLYA